MSQKLSDQDVQQRAYGWGIISALVPSLLLGGYGYIEQHALYGMSWIVYLLVGILICGPVFSRLHILIPGPSWARGVIFGLGLWFVDMLVVSPAFGGGPFGANLGKWAPIFSLVIFILWGAILGTIYGMIASGWKASTAVGLAFAVFLVAALTIRTVLFQPISIAGEAFKPTLQSGDYVLLSKYAYGYSRYSLPLSPPLFAGRIFARQPAYGDLVVFRLPKDDTQEWVGRIVGLPGDRLQMISGFLQINGAHVMQDRIADYTEGMNGPTLFGVKRWRETLPNGVKYDKLDFTDKGFTDKGSAYNSQVYTVPPEYYFTMVDIRDSSLDGRVSQVGFVPFANFVGRIDLVFMRRR